jgi:3-phenylpropionate/trans-cinnamate dioxygenase ferredoxin reductase subunit
VSDRVVIAGAGECGAHTALALRRRGFRGEIVLVSAEDSLPYERPPLSKDVIVALDEPEPRVIAGDALLSELCVRFQRGISVQEIDRNRRVVRLSDGSTQGFDRLVIATGSKVRRLPGVPDDPRVRVLRSFQDALALRQLARPGSKALVIGGGFIGLEVAASCRSRGCSVDVVETAPRLLARVVPVEIASAVALLHERQGVTLHLDACVTSIEPRVTGLGVALRQDRSLEVDFVVVGIGVDPETALAARAGLRINNGVAVNERLETDQSGIFAAGDCCSFPHPLFGDKRIRLESWRNAQKQADHVARNILAEGAPFDAVPWSWSDQYQWTLQVAGLPNEGVATIVRDLSATDRLWFRLDPEGRIVGAAGLGKGAAVAKEIRLTETLIARRARPARNLLEDKDISLKSLLLN